MCGVSGYFFNNKNNYLKSLKEVTNNIVHRGPDHIGFGHLKKMESILDIQGSQFWI